MCAKTASLHVPVVPPISTQVRKFCVLACARDWSSVGSGLCTVSSVLTTYHLWGPAFRIHLPRRPIHIKFMGARYCGVLLAGLLRAEVFVHVALCCASALVRSDSMKSDFAQQCKSVAMNLGVVARSQTACSVLVAVARQC